MGLDFFKRAVDLVHAYARPGVEIQHTMQTNGMLLNADWCRFFHEQRFSIGLSLDGPQAMHDTYRVDKGGAPTFQKVMRAAQLLQEHKVEFNILTTVNFVEPKYLLGNIKRQHMIELVSSEKQRQFGLHKRDSLPRYCRECQVRFACNGECPKNRFIETPDGESGLNYLCAGYKAFFTHVDKPMHIMAELLRRDRAPAEVKLVLAAEEAQLQKDLLCTLI